MAKTETDMDWGSVGVALQDDPDFVPIDSLLEQEGAGDGHEQDEPPEPNKDNDTDPNAEDPVNTEPGQGRQEGENKAGKDTDPQGSPDDTPTSIALAFMEMKEKGGVFSTLSDDTIKKVKDAYELKDLIQMEVENLRDEDSKALAAENQRIRELLSGGMEPNAINFYERQRKYFEDYDESVLEDEGENGDKERKNILMLQYKLKGMSAEDADRLVKMSFDSDSDVADAKKALAFCRDAYDNAYKKAMSEAKQKNEEQIERNRKRAEAMKTAVMEGKGYFDDLKVSKETRARIFDYIGKPQYELKGEDGKVLKDYNGNPLKVSGLTKFCHDKQDEANRLLATILVLTDEGKDFSKLFKGPVSEESRKISQHLEDAFVNSTRRDKNGSFKPDDGVSQAIDFDDIVGLAPGN